MTALVTDRATTGVDTVRVVTIDPWSDPRWQAFVAAHPDGLVYHHPAWLRLIAQVYGYTPHHLAAEDGDGRLRGVLPLFARRGLVSGRTLASLPHTPVAGPLAADVETAAALMRAAVARVRAAPGAQLQLKLPLEARVEGVDGLTISPWRASYVLDLPVDAGALRFGNARNHARIKWAVGKAERSGVVVRAAETERDLRAWYPLYLDALRRHGVPPHPYRFFTRAWQTLRPAGLLRLLLAEQRQGGRRRLLAGSILLMHGRTVFYAFNGRLAAALPLRPNDAIHWRAIHDACREGYHRYDFGEVTDGNQGLAEFKSKWGTTQRWLSRCYYPAPREVERGALDQDSAPRRLATAAWARTPLSVTARLGYYLYRYL